MILEPSRTIEIQYDQYNRQWQVQLYIDDKYISLTRHSDQCTAFRHAQCDAWEIEELHGQKTIIKISSARKSINPISVAFNSLPFFLAITSSLNTC